MKIVLLEPYFGGSHQRWAQELQAFSKHEIAILSLPARHWKWRMHGAAITLAHQFLAIKEKPDLIIATDMLDLSLFLSLTRSTTNDIPCLLYFHENQLTYPPSPSDTDASIGRDRHYGFINYHSALVADAVLFNSNFHKSDFLESLKPFLRAFPDFQNLETIQTIGKKSKVLPVGIVAPSHNSKPPAINEIPTILWNHRWEYDKNPELFFKTLQEIKAKKIPFRLIVLGKSARTFPPVFDWAKRHLTHETIHFGYCETHEDYLQKVTRSHILPVTSNQDFFGISIVEAIAAGVTPLLPNRLAYPAHIPQTYQKDLLYDSDQDLKHKLIQLIKHPRSFPLLDQHISKYFWKNIIEDYDWFFSTFDSKSPFPAKG